MTCSSASLSLLLVLAGVCVGRSVLETNHVAEDEDVVGVGREASSLLGDLHSAVRTYGECASRSDVGACLKVKLLVALDGVARSRGELQLLDGVSFVNDAKGDADSAGVEKPSKAPASEVDVEAALPRVLGDKDAALDALIVDKVVDFFRSHTLRLSLAPGDSEGQSLLLVF